MNEEHRATITSLRFIQKELNEAFFERRAVIGGLWLALLAHQHCLLLGPTGSGKRSLVQAISRRIVHSPSNEGVRFVPYSLLPTTREEEIFGPLPRTSPRQESRSKASEAEILFLENIGTSYRPHLRQRLTHLLSERRLEDGVPAPLITCVGVSAEALEAEEHRPLREQFLLTYLVPYLSDRSFFALLQRHSHNARQVPDHSRDTTGTTISQQAFAALQLFCDTVTVSPEASHKLEDIWSTLHQQGIWVSVERKRSSVSLLQAQAALRGRDTVLQDDLSLLTHSAWTHLADRQATARLISSMI